VRQPLTLQELAWNRNSIALAITVLAVIAFGGVLFYAHDYLRWVVRGPEPVTFTQLSKMGAEAAGSWFEVTAEVRPVHVLQTTSHGRRGRTTITNHFALISDKAIMIETGRSALPATFAAWATEFDENNAYYNRARRQLNDRGGTRIPFSPLLLHSLGDVTSTRWLVGSAISIVTIVLIVILWRILRTLQDYTRTAPIARLRKSVRASEGLPALITEIDGQLAALDPNIRRSGPILLPSWLVSIGRNNFSLLSSSDVVWVAPYIVTRKLYSVIPLSKKHSVRVFGRANQVMALEMPESSVQEVLKIFYQWAPWAVIGVDPAMHARFGTGRTSLARLFSKQPSRAELIAAIDKRREQFLATRAMQMSGAGAGPAT
jgi:hypothetical protein